MEVFFIFQDFKKKFVLNCENISVICVKKHHQKVLKFKNKN